MLRGFWCYCFLLLGKGVGSSPGEEEEEEGGGEEVLFGF